MTVRKTCEVSVQAEAVRIADVFGVGQTASWADDKASHLVCVQVYGNRRGIVYA